LEKLGLDAEARAYLLQTTAVKGEATLRDVPWSFCALKPESNDHPAR